MFSVKVTPLLPHPLQFPQCHWRTSSFFKELLAFSYLQQLTLTCLADTHTRTRTHTVTPPRPHVHRGAFISPPSSGASSLLFPHFLCACVPSAPSRLQMSLEVDLEGLFSQNGTYDYDESYEYKDELDPRRVSAVWIVVLYSLLTVLGLLGNGLLMAALALKRTSSWTLSDTFVFHQGVVDVLLLATLPFWARQASRPCGGCFEGVLCKIGGAVLNVSEEFLPRGKGGEALSSARIRFIYL